MGEFKKGELNSGSKEGPEVTSRKQAVAIALSQAGISKKKVDEDFDLDAVMEEIKANLGEEAFNVIFERIVNKTQTFDDGSTLTTSTGLRSDAPVQVSSTARLGGGRPGERGSMATSRVPLPQQGTQERAALDNQLDRTQTQSPPPRSPYGDLGAATSALSRTQSSTPSMVANGPRLSPSTFRGNTPTATTQQALGNTSDARSSSYASRSPLSTQSSGFSTDKPSAPSPAARPSTPAPSSAARTAATPAPEPKSRQMFQAAQDRASSGENDSAAFFAADKQRTAELRGMQESKSLTSTINKILKG